MDPADRCDQLCGYYRHAFISTTTDDHAMFDILEQRFVRIVHGSIDGVPTTNEIDPRFAKIIKSLMTSTTPFCLYYGFIVIYSRSRLWVYARMRSTLTSIPIIPERYIPYFNAEVIVRCKRMVILTMSEIVVIQGRYIMFMYKVKDLILDRVNDQLYLLPPNYRVISASSINMRSNFIIMNPFTKQSLYGEVEWVDNQKQFQWYELPVGGYYVAFARLVREINGEYEQVSARDTLPMTTLAIIPIE